MLKFSATVSVASESVASDGSALTLTGVSESTVTITVTSQDSDGNRVNEASDDPVARKYAGLISRMYEWRNNNPELTFGETVSDTSLTTMPAAEAQGYADRGCTRWVRWPPRFGRSRPASSQCKESRHGAGVRLRLDPRVRLQVG